MKHLISIEQMSRAELLDFFIKCQSISTDNEPKILKGKKLMTFFYEPSTRTRASFEIAFQKLGGDVIFTTENARVFSSVSKGETLEDTIQVLNAYEPDVIALRYDREGGMSRAVGVSKCSIINAGDGTGEHPTQSLLDSLTIFNKFNRLDNLSISFVGDIKNGRTVKSLSKLLSNFNNITMNFIASSELQLTDEMRFLLQQRGVNINTFDNINAGLDCDILYMTRLQKERGSTTSDWGKFSISEENIHLFKTNGIILHPLPRNEEISFHIDTDPRALYLTEQVRNGLIVRMQLFKDILG